MNDLVKIGIAGLGTIGSGVIKNLLRNKKELEEKYQFEFEVSGISASKKDKKRSFDTSQFIWFDNPIDLILPSFSQFDKTSKTDMIFSLTIFVS